MEKKIKIAVFLDEAGKIKQVPSPNRTKIPVLAYLADKFEPDRQYTEKEVNQIIEKWHTFGDYFLLRRLLVDYDFLARTPDGAQYWVVKKDEAAAQDEAQEKTQDKNKENSDG
jgi:hypothetical protein